MASEETKNEADKKRKEAEDLGEVARREKREEEAKKKVEEKKRDIEKKKERGEE